MALSEAGTDDPSALRFREYLEQPCRRELVNEISLLSLFLLLDCQIKWRKWRFMLLLRKEKVFFVLKIFKEQHPNASEQSSSQI